MEKHLMAFLASLATLVQTTLQTVFILDASSRFAYTNEQVKNKPGREVVTFLLVCNLAMWAINTLETNRADSHPIQVKPCWIKNPGIQNLITLEILQIIIF